MNEKFLKDYPVLEQIQQVKRAFRKGIITNGEYLGKVGEILMIEEKRLFEQDSNKPFDEIPEYVALLDEVNK